MIQNFHSEDQVESLLLSIEALESTLVETVGVVESYSRPGYLKHFLNGSKPQDTFNNLDSEMNKCIYQISFALQIEPVKFETERHEVICGIQDKLDSLSGNPEALADFAESFGADLSDLREEINFHLSQLEYDVDSHIIHSSEMLTELYENGLPVDYEVKSSVLSKVTHSYCLYV